MSTDMVRVFDSATETITTIPAAELASGMIRMRIEGVEGDVWVDASSAPVQGPIRHPPFGEEARELVRQFECIFADVSPRTLEEWEEGFRCDMNPDRELTIWVIIAEGFQRFTSHLPTSPANKEKRQDVFDVVLACVNNGPAHVRHTTNPRTLSARRVKEITDWYVERLESPLPVVPIVHPLPNPVPVCELFAPDGRGPNPLHDPGPALNASDVILGVDLTTGQEFIVFGRGVLKDLAGSGQGRNLRVVRVSLDAATKELDMLLGVVQAVKGRHEYVPE